MTAHLSLPKTPHSSRRNSRKNRNFTRGFFFGFNGKESDNSTAADSYDFGARILDARIGRWLGVDGCFKLYPEATPYCFAANFPIRAVDKSGLYVYIKIGVYNEESKTFEKTWIQVQSVEDLVSRNPALALLNYTDEGAQELSRYVNSDKNDVYLAFEDFDYQPNGDNFNVSAGGVTVFNYSGLYEDEGFSAEKAVPQSDLDRRDAVDMLKNFDGVRAREGAETTSLVIINKSNVSHGSSKNWLDGMENEAASIFHELYAHITLRLNSVAGMEMQHDTYGETSKRDTKKGTCAEEIRQELDKCSTEWEEEDYNKR